MRQRFTCVAIAFGALSIASILLFGAAPGRAEVNTLARAGTWEAFRGTTSKAEPICGMASEVSTHYFGIKRISGKTGLILQFGTAEWKMANGQKMRVVITFEANRSWSAAATGFHFDDGDPGLEFNIGDGDINSFLRSFRDSAQMQVQTPDATFVDWQVSLSGSGQVADAFQNCMRSLR